MNIHQTDIWKDGTALENTYENDKYAGAWHLYVAHTYDRGLTWDVADLSPSDPIQRGCIWWGNGSCPNGQR